MTEAVARNLFATRCQAIKELLQFIIRQRDGAQHRQQALAHDSAGGIEHMYASCMLLLRTSRRCNAVRHIFSISQIVKPQICRASSSFKPQRPPGATCAPSVAFNLPPTHVARNLI
jgi:hypothetical protein